MGKMLTMKRLNQGIMKHNQVDSIVIIGLLIDKKNPGRTERLGKLIIKNLNKVRKIK